MVSMMLLFLESVTISENVLALAIGSIFSASAVAHAAQWRALQQCQDRRSVQMHDTLTAMHEQTAATREMAAAMNGLIEAFGELQDKVGA